MIYDIDFKACEIVELYRRVIFKWLLGRFSILKQKNNELLLVWCAEKAFLVGFGVGVMDLLAELMKEGQLQKCAIQQIPGLSRHHHNCIGQIRTLKDLAFGILELLEDLRRSIHYPACSVRTDNSLLVLIIL